MASGKRVLAPVRLVFQDDTAIDSAKSDWQRYLREGCNWEFLHMLPGAVPTVFSLKRMTYSQREHARQIDGAFARQWFAFRCGLEAIENYRIEDVDGNVVGELPAIEWENSSALGKMVADAWMKRAELPDEQVVSAGVLVLAISECNYPLFKRSVAPTGDGGR